MSNLLNKLTLGSTTWMEPWVVGGKRLPSGGNQLKRVLLWSSHAVNSRFAGR